MKKYLGVKLIEAEPCSKINTTTYSCTEPGYKVKYEDGYESWSPKDVFEKAYRPIDGLTFGLAIEALKQGKCVARKGWNGKGMFVCKQIPTEIDKSIHYQNQMIIVKDDNTIDSWVASYSDTFAEDWMIVE